ncbi:TonB family protein [Paraburkholderia xenovorans]|uniref:energy transducer TonB n=1 Tax=Paraburkholderia xenovorans TaxID=36873 RepID=UPI0038BC80E3
MNNVSRIVVKAGDNQKARVVMAAALGALVWVIVLVVLGRGLRNASVPEPAPEPPLEMSVVEMPVPAPEPVAQPAAEPVRLSSPKQPPVKAVRTQTPPLRMSTPAPKSEPVTPAAEPTPVAAQASHSAAQTATTSAASPSPERSAPGAEPSSTSSTAGNSPARAISQPLPAVPDELREEAYQTVAIAHLVIHTDGSVAVELTKPTRYPRLNQILLETLRNWRFFPAIRDGHPVETQQDVRVHFDVS